MLRRKVDVTSFKEEVERLRRSRLAVILLVYFALVMDNMLLTVVVPIIPDYLYQMEYQQTEKVGEESLVKASLPLAASSNPYPPTVPGYLNLETLSYPDEEDESDDLLVPGSRAQDNASPTPRETESDDATASSRTSNNPKSLSNLNQLHSRLKMSSPGRPPEETTTPATPTASRYLANSEISEADIQRLLASGKGYGMLDSQHSQEAASRRGAFRLLKYFKRERRQLSNTSLGEMQDHISAKSLKGLSTTKVPLRNHVLPLESRSDKSHPLNSSGNSEIHSSLFTKVHPPEFHPTNAHGTQKRMSSTQDASSSPETSSPHLKISEENNTSFSENNVNATLTPEVAPEALNSSLNNKLLTGKLPQDIINENGRVGLLFSSKAFVQLIVNPFIGPLTSRIGYSLPLLVGTHNLIISALLFAYGETYTLLFIARSIQGIASSCIAISGMGIVAQCYPEDQERGRMQGLVMGGIALGVLAGYPLGGLLYDFTNSKTPPFLLIAALTAVLALIQLAVLNPRPTPERLVVATPMSGLIRDPYILVTAGAVMVSTSAMAVLEPCLPIWLTDTLHPQKWQLGTAFIPDSIGYLVGTSCTAGTAYRIGRWRAAVIAMMMVAFAAATVPEARSMLSLAGPHLFLGMGVGTVDAALMPLLAAIVDARHVAAYGAVYAIAQAAVALAYGFGPLVGGAVVRQIGFPWLMRGVAILNLCYCPLLFSLTTFVHDSSETQAILMAAPDPSDYNRHTTTSVQPREASLRYQQLFDEEED